jgi:ribokinase
VRSIDDARACAKHLVAQGLKRVIITLGENGALVSYDGGEELIAPYRVTTKDTTGAGDAFVGSFAVFLGEGLSERDAIARANLYAALSTTSVGTQKSFITRERFEEEWRTRAAGGPAVANR